MPRELRLQRLETTSRPESEDTRGIAATRSSPVEWTRNAGACVTPFNLQHSLSLLRDGVGARSTKPLTYYAAHYTRIAEGSIHHRPGPRRLHKRGGAAVRCEAGSQARPARLGTARTVTLASRSPSPAATAWPSGARLTRRSLPVVTSSAAPIEDGPPGAGLNLHAQGTCGRYPVTSVRFLRVHWLSNKGVRLLSAPKQVP